MTKCEQAQIILKQHGISWYVTEVKQIEKGYVFNCRYSENSYRISYNVELDKLYGLICY